jgi:hypothetical protein
MHLQKGKIMQSTPRIGENGVRVSGPAGAARPAVIESINADGTVNVIQDDITGGTTVVTAAYPNQEFVAVGGVPSGSAYFQQVDYSA